MIWRCGEEDFEAIWEIVNDGAQAYCGVIPADCWAEPYMSREELRHEIEDGVEFWGYDDDDHLVGVMGIQKVEDVTLIRHAYVRTENQKQGVGAKLLEHLLGLAASPVLVGTWTDAAWAIRFYEKYGFQLVSEAEKNRLLRQYWTISERQVETSVVLADAAWRDSRSMELPFPDLASEKSES
ncbi:MAG TPA: GNAT family N-acetyltransferase [Terracidiphilus sp.]|nr:GNAT family N-acetyltransferase [Terracidiphilus sp.]